MKLFLDTEFNGFGGELISMAIVPEVMNGDEFYEVVQIPEQPIGFVAEHVLPKLERAPIGWEKFTRRLSDYLGYYNMSMEIIADWPADFEHFMDWVSEMGRQRDWSLPFEVTMHLVRGDATIQPTNPHNALSDARALRDWWKRQQPSDKSGEMG